MPLKNVSRETLAKLEIYLALLGKWQKAVNLVGPNTMADAWHRHFMDSAQIANYIPQDAQTLLDFGSGAGFPGLVLAMLRPDLDVNLVESDEKKCQFLRNVSRETSTPVTIHNTRIEYLKASGQEIMPDIITARALGDLKMLLDFALPYAQKNPELVLLLPKGEKAPEEITAAKAIFSFDLQAHKSITNNRAQILEIRQLKRL